MVRDPESRQGQTMTITRFTLAVDRPSRDGETAADFPSCVAFGKRAEAIAKYFTKGAKILIGGHLHTDSYTKQDGTKVYTTEVIVDNFWFCESKKSEETKADKPVTDDEGFMDIPDNIPELPFD